MGICGILPIFPENILFKPQLKTFRFFPNPNSRSIMSEYSYTLIEPLLTHSQTEGNRIYCSFRTPSGDIVEAFATMPRPSGVQGKIKEQLTKTAARSARRIAARSIRSVLGGGMFGRMGSQIARSVVTPENVGVSAYGTAEKQAGIVAAFAKVSDRFRFDDVTGQWSDAVAMPKTTRSKIKIGGNRLTSAERRAARAEKKAAEAAAAENKTALFDVQLADAPVESAYDKEITARILTELANADGRISREEKEFLKEIIPPELGTIESLLARDPVSRIECEEVSDKVKETIYMLAWTIALADFSVDPSETDILAEYADMFDLSSDRRDAMVKAAKFNMLEKSIDSGISRAELFELADKLEMSNDDAERCLIELKKRS